MIEVWRDPGLWVLFELEDGRLVLSVNCGTSVSYDTKHVLSAEEREEYMVAGWVYLGLLAEKVSRNPWAYRDELPDLPQTDFSIAEAEPKAIPTWRTQK